MDKLIVVGVGSSAGGLEALTSLVHGLEPKDGFAYVVAQHLAPQHRSMMVELLGRASPIPVVEAIDGERLRGGEVFIAPPNKNISIDRDRIVLSETFAEGPKPSIDSFFASLAETVGSEAVGIILSGTGSDGARGVRAIHAAGGLTIAQDSQSAKYPSMPEAALRSGVIDLVLRPEQIGPHLRQAFSGEALTEDDRQPPTAARGFARIIQLLQRQSGIDFRLYKQGTLTRRIERRLRAQGMTEQEDYLALLERDTQELDLLVGDILVSVTAFFRDPEAFEALSVALAEYLARKPPGEPIRAWVPGCATGEEAYSIAMVIAEVLRTAKTKRAVQIFAVDVDEHALETARRGIYSSAAINDIPAKVRKRYAQKLDTGEFRVAKEIRDMVLFSRLDLTRDPPFSRIDLVSCRNLLIYFDNELQERTINLFQYALTPGGVLMLGRSETVGDGGRFFDVLDKTQKLYARKAGARLPLGRPTLSPRLDLPTKLEPRKREWLMPEETLLRGLTAAFAPPSVLIDDADRVVHAIGDLSGFLTVNPGRFNQDLLSLVVPGLRAALRSAVYRATHNASGRSQFIWKETANGKKTGSAVKITVAPVGENESTGQRWRFVSFERVATVRSESSGATTLAPGGGSDERLVDLENELAATREHLQTVIQELENANEELQAANEELQSANEEMQATNEELETSNEELQATNEELETINEELRVKTDELAEKAADLDNVLRCAPAATIVIDRDLRIRLFNQSAQKIFRITTSDIGHMITQVPARIEMFMIREKLLGVMETGMPFQRDVIDETGRYYEKIIAPYFDAHQQVAGAILTLTDITDRAEDQRKLREATRQLKEAQRIAHVGDWRWDLRSGELTWSEEIYRLYGLDPGTFRPNLESMLACYGEPDRIAVRGKFETALREGKEFSYNLRIARADGEARDIAAEAFCELDSAGRVVAIFGVMRDRTTDLAIQTALDDSQRRLQTIINTIVEGVVVTDRNGVIRLTNRALERTFGYGPGALDGKNINLLMPDTVHRHHDGFIRRYHETQQKRFTGRQQEVRGRRKDGSELPIEIWVEEVIDERSALLEEDRHIFIATVHDISPRKAYEDALIQAKRAAEAANEAKSIFLAEMSHELRTPLNAIIGFSEMIKDQLLGPIGNAKYRQYGEDIYSSGRHLLDIISDILDLSSVEAGKFKIEDGIVEVSEALSDCVRLVENSARAREVSIQIDSGARMPKLRADPRAFRQVLINLLSNAVKFTPAQGKVMVSARYSAEEGFIVTVADTGIGMTEEEIQNAFKPFGRVDNERIRDVASGTGLGLPITKSLVEMHGGTLRLEGAVNKGTTATVNLPAARAIADGRRR